MFKAKPPATSSRFRRVEEDGRLRDGHIEDAGDRLPFPEDAQRFPVVSLPSADLAGHVDIRKEVHLDPDHAVALARLAPPPFTLKENRPGA